MDLIAQMPRPAGTISGSMARVCLTLAFQFGPNGREGCAHVLTSAYRSLSGALPPSNRNEPRTIMRQVDGSS